MVHDPPPENGEPETAKTQPEPATEAPGPRLVTPTEAQSGASGSHPPVLRVMSQKDMDVTVYDTMWSLYRDGLRASRRLAKAVGVTRAIAERAIERGWPRQNLAPLAERAKLHDRQRLDVQTEADKEAYRAQVDEFYRARKRNIAYIEGGRGLADALLHKLLALIAPSSFTRYRRVRKVIAGEKGVERVEEVDEAFVYGPAVIQAIRATAATIRDLGSEHRKWLVVGQAAGVGPGSASSDEPQQRPNLVPLTEEQRRYILEHDGQLPPGVTEEQLWAEVSFMMQAAAGGATEPAK